MGKIGLQFKANLENVTNVMPLGNDFRWYLKFKCMNCGEETDKWQYLCIEEKYPIKGNRSGEASLVSKCKLCGRECSVDILEDSVTNYTIEDNNSFKTMVLFDCRGLEPIDFSPRIGFTAEGAESGTKFSDISLTDKEWVDYDERVNASVGIYELEYRFVNVK